MLKTRTNQGYDANKLNVALADIKAGIAKAKEAKGNLTEEDVRKIVEDTLKLQTRSGYNRETRSISSSILPSISQRVTF